MGAMPINKHGVTYVRKSVGSHFQRQVDGKWVTNAPIDVPLCCFTCGHYDSGEFGDYGECLSGPYCEKNLFFPTRRGECKLHTDPQVQFKTEAEWDAAFNAIEAELLEGAA